MEFIEKPIQNPKNSPYLDWIKSGKKKYEGRLKTKIKEWNLEIGMKIKFYDQNDKSSFVITEVISLLIFNDFGEAFDNLKGELIPEKSKEEVISLYNELFHYDDEVIEPGVISKMIKDIGVICIGLKVIF